MSEVLTELAVVTGNASWLHLASAFERPCFVRPLMLEYQQRRQDADWDAPSHRDAADRDAADRGAARGSSSQLIRTATSAGGGSVSLAARAIEQMHGNTHLPQLLGLMARFDSRT